MPTTVKTAIGELFGVSPMEFASEYWGKKTILRAGGGQKLLDTLGLSCTREELFEVLRSTAAMEPPLETFTLNAGRENTEFAVPGTPPAALREIPAAELEGEFAAGNSIIAQAIAHKGLAKLAARLKSELGFAGEARVNAVCGSKGTRFMAHLDTFDNFFVQVHGEKRWLLSKEAIAHAPRDVGYFFANGTGRFKKDPDTVLHYDRGDLLEVVLQPGDMLFVPAGALHGTETLSECSIGLSVFFMHLNFASVLTEYVMRDVANRETWSRLPLRSISGAGETGLKDVFLERLSELREAVESAGDSDFDSMWTQLLYRPGPSVGRTLAECVEPEKVVLAPDLVLEVCSAPPVTAVWKGDALLLYTMLGQLEVGGGSAKFIEMVLEQQRFTVRETLEWVGAGEDEETSFPLLRTLLRYGAIAPAE